MEVEAAELAAVPSDPVQGYTDHFHRFLLSGDNHVKRPVMNQGMRVAILPALVAALRLAGERLVRDHKMLVEGVAILG